MMSTESLLIALPVWSIRLARMRCGPRLSRGMVYCVLLELDSFWPLSSMTIRCEGASFSRVVTRIVVGIRPLGMISPLAGL